MAGLSFGVVFRCDLGLALGRCRGLGCFGPCAIALAKADPENIEATVRKRRIFFARFVARTGKERLPRRVMFGELVVGKSYSEGQEKDWMVRLEEDMAEFSMTFEGCRKAAQKAGRWNRRVEVGQRHSCGYGMTRRAVELQSDSQRPRQRRPPSASTRVGGRGGGEGERPAQDTEGWVWQSSF